MLLFLSGCINSISTLEERKNRVSDLTKNEQVTSKVIPTSHFSLFSLQSLFTCKNKSLHVYIEGDGFAWITRSIVSDDPTPLNPTALSLMLQDNATCKVYLARPCQYLFQKECDNSYWTSHRFSQKVIHSYHDALNELKSLHGNATFTLIGYSGGGAVATLLASQREDVSMLVTVAGNLDTDRWVQFHQITPLSGSLNPAHFTEKLEQIEQYHLVGKNDKIIPKPVFDAYLSRFKNTEKIYYVEYDAQHACCWDGHYKHFLKRFTIDGNN